MSVSFPTKKVITRKPHRCFGCSRKFEPKTSMVINSGIWEGDLYSYYLCNTCESLLPIYSKDLDYSDGIEEGFVVEWKNNREQTAEQFLESLKNI